MAISNAPWHVSGSNVPIVYDADGWAVCNAVTFHGRHRGADAMDNAALIAVAPELLEAAALLIQQYESSGDFVMGGNLTNAPFLALKAAVAKARANA